MSNPNVGEWVPVETMDGAGRVRADHGALHLDGLSWAYLSAAQWEALKATGDRLMAGVRGREALALATEAGARDGFATLVAALFPFPDQVPDAEEMTDAQWAHAARVLAEAPGLFTLLRSWWDAPEGDGEPPGGEAAEDDEAPPMRTVTIPASDQHEGFHSIRVTLPWACPQCGGPRGEPAPAISYDGSRRLGCDGWKNPCGHVDHYSAVRQEARALASSEAAP